MNSDSRCPESGGIAADAFSQTLQPWHYPNTEDSKWCRIKDGHSVPYNVVITLWPLDIGSSSCEDPSCRNAGASGLAASLAGSWPLRRVGGLLPPFSDFVKKRLSRRRRRKAKGPRKAAPVFANGFMILVYSAALFPTLQIEQ